MAIGVRLTNCSDSTFGSISVQGFDQGIHISESDRNEFGEVVVRNARIALDVERSANNSFGKIDVSQDNLRRIGKSKFWEALNRSASAITIASILLHLF